MTAENTSQQDAESPASEEGGYYLEEDDDVESKSQKTAYCCTGNGKPITTAELWLELKDLTSELWDYVKYRCWKKKLLTAVLGICAIAVCVDLLFFGFILKQLALFVAWMAQHPVIGVFAYVLVFVILTCKCVRVCLSATLCSLQNWLTLMLDISNVRPRSLSCFCCWVCVLGCHWDMGGA